MIYLVTGRNGAGKTQLVIRSLLSDERFRGRPVVLRGIPVLRSAFRRLRILATFDASDPGWLGHWWELVDGPLDGDLAARREISPGTLFVLDESWDLLGGARGSQGRDHPWVNPLKTHRHYGLDFIFIGQGIKDFPPVLRELAGEHWHVERVADKMRVLVFKNRCGDPESMTDRAMSERLPWEPKATDPEVWRLYHSADLHTASVGRGGRYYAARRKLITLASVFVLVAAGVVYAALTSDIPSLLGFAAAPASVVPGAVDDPSSDSGLSDPPVSPLGPGVSREIALSVQGFNSYLGDIRGSRRSRPPSREWLVADGVRREPDSPDCAVLVARIGGRLVDPVPRDAAPSALEYPVNYLADYSLGLRSSFVCHTDVIDHGEYLECPELGVKPAHLVGKPVVWTWELLDCDSGVAYWRLPDDDPPRRRRDDDPPRRRRDDDLPRSPSSSPGFGAPLDLAPGRSRVIFQGDGIDPRRIDSYGGLLPDGAASPSGPSDP